MKCSQQLTRSRLSAAKELNVWSSSLYLCQCIPSGDDAAASWSLLFAVIVAARRSKMGLNDSSASAEQREEKRKGSTTVRSSTVATRLLELRFFI
eukprot:scaffold26152_cov75-Skeletonema_dohrnii-CCMP3373.AAC.3